MVILYENKQTKDIRYVHEGFNIFAFFFGPLWYLFKGMIVWGVLFVIAGWFVGSLGFVWLVLLSIIWGFIGDKQFVKHLKENGYEKVPENLVVQDEYKAVFPISSAIKPAKRPTRLIKKHSKRKSKK